ncbi:MAG: hypothetical protein ACRDTU_17345 [Micromonosporaceae bacterium]
MTRTAEIITGADAARGRIAEARAEATDALNLAYELMEVAAAHGWDGVATSMNSAKETLEAVIAHADNADQAAGAAVTVLGEITSKLSSYEVAERLATVIQHFDQVRDGIDSATGSVNDTRHACQQAGEPYELLQILQVISDDLGEARHSVDKTTSVTESERQDAETWGD